MMIHINCIISLIKYIKKNNSCHFTILRCRYLSVKSRTFNTSTKNVSQAQDSLTLNNHNTEEKSTLDAKENKMSKTEIKNGSYIHNLLRIVNPEFAEIYPSKYIKSETKPNDTIYLFEKETAKTFVDLIIDDLSKSMTYVAEANPGTGLLTEELLKAGVEQVHAYESKECFHPILGNLEQKYPKRIYISQYNLFKMSKLHYMDNLDYKNRVKSILKGVKPTSWEGKPCMQVIGAVTNLVFLKHIILCVIFQSCFMSLGRTCFYLAIPPSIWNVLSFPPSAGRRYARYVLFQTLFDSKYLGEIKRTSYIPWQKKKSMISKKFDHEILFVVKIEPKANLLTDYLKQHQLLPYWYFVKYHLTSKKCRVIPDLEKWIPGCGVRLIMKNYNIFTQFIDLKPDEILTLYKEFASWPEYETCLFLSSANSFIQNMNQNTHISCTRNDDLYK